MNNATKANATEPVGALLVRGVRPCGWRWLDSWIFRKRVPSYSTQSEWGPVYDKEALDAAVAAERERCAALCLRPPGWLSDSHQALATEIRNAILGNAGRLQGPNA